MDPNRWKSRPIRALQISSKGSPQTSEPQTWPMHYEHHDTLESPTIMCPGLSLSSWSVILPYLHKTIIFVNVQIGNNISNHKNPGLSQKTAQKNPSLTSRTFQAQSWDRSQFSTQNLLPRSQFLLDKVRPGREEEQGSVPELWGPKLNFQSTKMKEYG